MRGKLFWVWEWVFKTTTFMPSIIRTCSTVWGAVLTDCDENLMDGNKPLMGLTRWFVLHSCTLSSSNTILIFCLSVTLRYAWHLTFTFKRLIKPIFHNCEFFSPQKWCCILCQNSVDHNNTIYMVNLSCGATPNMPRQITIVEQFWHNVVQNLLSCLLHMPDSVSIGSRSWETWEYKS